MTPPEKDQARAESVTLWRCEYDHISNECQDETDTVPGSHRLCIRCSHPVEPFIPAPEDETRPCWCGKTYPHCGHGGFRLPEHGLSEGDVVSLAIAYRNDSLGIAQLCDEHLDRSGRLLGEVRKLARADSVPPAPEGGEARGLLEQAVWALQPFADAHRENENGAYIHDAAAITTAPNSPVDPWLAAREVKDRIDAALSNPVPGEGEARLRQALEQMDDAARHHAHHLDKSRRDHNEPAEHFHDGKAQGFRLAAAWLRAALAPEGEQRKLTVNPAYRLDEQPRAEGER